MSQPAVQYALWIRSKKKRFEQGLLVDSIYLLRRKLLGRLFVYLPPIQGYIHPQDANAILSMIDLLSSQSRHLKTKAVWTNYRRD